MWVGGLIRIVFERRRDIDRRMTKRENLFGFSRKLWISGAIVSITSVVFMFAGLYAVMYLIPYGGMRPPRETRWISPGEFCLDYWLHGCIEICLVSAVFAVAGAIMRLVYGLKRKPVFLVPKL